VDGVEMTEGVQNFLSRLGLDGHLEMFMARGFDSEDDIPHLQDADLDAMYITNQDERSKILEAGKSIDLQFISSNRL
jgi:hypothetical protein